MSADNREQTQENFNSSLQQNYLVLTRDYSSQSIAELLMTHISKFNSSLAFLIQVLVYLSLLLELSQKECCFLYYIKYKIAITQAKPQLEHHLD